EVIENGKATGKFINADNIDGTERTLKHNAYVYKTSKKRANKVVLKKGDKVVTYGGSYKFKNGKRYYKIGNNTEKTYVKASNF
ncbi:MAG: SLAP domain-containing protein, partial [Lactobacillus crispatus]|nr:SLAP domain-containing protein [Lactobacillus crispatus]